MKAVLEHYRGNEQFVARILDLMDQSERQYRCLITPFLTPQEQQIALKVIGKRLYVSLWGGYDQAERRRLMMAPYEFESDGEIVCLKGHYPPGDKTLTHRDVLGALMHLGIARDQIGDILVQKADFFVFVRGELSAFVRQELTRIRTNTITLEEYQGAVNYETKVQWHTTSVSSMRLDCIVAACIHGSRSKAQPLIKGNCVKVDHIPLEDCKVLCNNNCTVSIRGYGRFLVRASMRTSRKGRLMIEIGTYQ